MVQGRATQPAAADRALPGWERPNRPENDIELLTGGLLPI
jgi:hypothetical protein